MSSNLVPPPKFGPGPGQAPTSVDDWNQFFRWLFSLWRKAATSIDAQTSITISPPTDSGPQAEGILAAARASMSFPKPAGHQLDEVIAAAIAFSSLMAPGVREIDALPNLPRQIERTLVPDAIPPQSTVQTAIDAGSPAAAQVIRTVQDELGTLILMALSRPPYPSRASVALANFSAQSNAGLVLTNVYQDIPGLTITLDDPGTYLAIMSVEFQHFSGDDIIRAKLFVDGTAQHGQLVMSETSGTLFSTPCRSYIFTAATSGIVVKGMAEMDAGAGGSNAVSAQATLDVIQIG